MRLFNYLLVLIAATLLVIGCGEDYQYKKAKEANTIEEYENFISKYPKSKYANEINDSLALFYYKIVKDSNSIEQYEKFLERWPESEYASELADSLRNLYYNKTITVNTIRACNEFLSKYSNGDYVSKIEKLLLELRYMEAKNVATKDIYNKFINDYPDHDYSRIFSAKLKPYSMKDLVGTWIGQASSIEWIGQANIIDRKLQINVTVDSQGNVEGGGFNAKWKIDKQGIVDGEGYLFIKSGSRYEMKFKHWSLVMNAKRTALSGYLNMMDVHLKKKNN